LSFFYFFLATSTRHQLQLASFFFPFFALYFGFGTGFTVQNFVNIVSKIKKKSKKQNIGHLTRYQTRNIRLKKEKKNFASCSWCLVLVAKKNKKMTTNLWYQIRGFPIVVCCSVSSLVSSAALKRQLKFFQLFSQRKRTKKSNLPNSFFFLI
jgi:hypothetical protein